MTIVTLTKIQEKLIERILNGRNCHQGLAVTNYKKQAVKLGYTAQQIIVQVKQCYDMADLTRNAQ